MQNKFKVFKELLELSQNEKRGLTIYLNGQTITGIVTNIIGKDAVELRSQMFGKIIVWLDSIEAAAVN